MPSLSGDPDRHVIIDQRPGHYLAFPDIIRTPSGRLIVAYNEMDRHVRPKRRVVVLKTSDDNGHTWSQPSYPDSKRSHCPRVLTLQDDKILISDSSRIFHLSTDDGTAWTPFQAAGLTHDMHDRVLVLDDCWLTTGHRHVGEEHTAIRQPPTEQIVFRSTDQGHTWKPFSTLATHRNLVLCEASMHRLPDGQILALMRENSFVFEPMYAKISDDNGRTWSAPMDTPLMGHRPTLGATRDGRQLVTYRNVSPDWGTAAWLGTETDLLSGFQVHGRSVDPTNPSFTQEGMRIHNGPGNKSVVRYALRPMTDPRSATATFSTRVRVDESDANGCGLRLGVWWRLTPKAITPESEGATPIALSPGFNEIKLKYGAGEVALFVNGQHKTTISVPDDHADTRPIMVGAPYPFEDNAVDCTWQTMALHIVEPAFEREYSWSWRAEEGLPDQWVQDNILELRNDRHAAAPDFGYSGWTELNDGHFFCAYHHGGGNQAGYEPLHTAYIAGTWFSAEDFSKE